MKTWGAGMGHGIAKDTKADRWIERCKTCWVLNQVVCRKNFRHLHGITQPLLVGAGKAGIAGLGHSGEEFGEVGQKLLLA